MFVKLANFWEKNVLLCVLIFVFYLFLYTYKIVDSYQFNTDIARDSYGIIEIAQGKFTLIGPKLNFGGLYAGPYYYYLFAPILFLSSYSFSSILLFNASLFALALVYFFLEVKKRASLLKSLLYTAAIGFLPLYMITARNPGNAYTYIPLFLVFLTYTYFGNPAKRSDFLLLGLACGIIVNFHFLNILAVCAIFAFLFYKIQNRKSFVYFFAAFFATFTPIIVFDVKHDFVVFKKTLFDYSQKSLIKYYTELDKVSLLARYLRNSYFVKNYILLNPIFYLILFVLPLAFKKYLIKKVFVFSIFTIISFVIYVYLAKADMVTHYFFSAGLLIFFTFIIFCLEYRLTIVVVLVLAFELLSFPVKLYHPSIRPFQKFEHAVDFVIDNNLVSRNVPFNLIQVIENDTKIPAGFEYRYFFRARGFVPKTINEYDKADKLFVFLERSNFNVGDLVNWESGQFGQQYIKNAKFYEAGEIDFYTIEKD